METTAEVPVPTESGPLAPTQQPQSPQNLPEGYKLTPDEEKALREWEAKTSRMVRTARARRELRTGPSAKAKRKLALQRAHAKREELMARRALVWEKIDKGLPITEEERELAGKKFGRVKKQEVVDRTIDAAAALVIKPSNVKELRLVVEQTAARYAYNPVEELIKLAQSEETSPEERAKINKTLLPYLVPTIAPMRATDDDEENKVDPNAPKVVIKNFVVQKEKPAVAIHESKRENMTSRAEIIVEPDAQ